ncbi:MAG: hypothetical protein DWC00_07400 [Candidatus Poseidoniales archaeon]|nr:MAG: hypothetical protein DWC00_07400 [Candidatus Poseidoniales archaeon]
MNLEWTIMRLFDISLRLPRTMRTVATIVLCLLLLPIVAPVLSASASLIDAGQTEQINEKVVAWQQLSDGKVLMVTGSGTLSVNTFESGMHTPVWSLDLNITAKSARVDSGENLVSVSHNSGVVIIQMTQQIITQYINTSNPVDAVDWDNDGDIWIGYFPGQRRAEEWSGGLPSGIVTDSHSGGMTSMIVTSDGHILTGGYDNRVKVHDNTGTLVQQLTDMTSAVNTLELDAQGRLLVGTAGGDLFRYNLSDYTYEMLSISSNPQLVYIEQMDFASYHVGTQSGEIIVVDVQTFQEGDMYDSSGKVIASLKGANGEVYIISGFTSSTRVRLYDIDSDGDGVTDALDAFPTNPSESLDTDGDGVGDNSDEFPTIPDESVDSDGDGVGDNSDMFPSNPDQTIDSDGDGYGDNSDGQDGDLYPTDSSQWADTDRDGYGDNPQGTLADGCPLVNGFSTQDRYGCPDGDLDGYSDPDQNWTAQQGADALPDMNSQWTDGDGDGYGDNATGAMPDKCPTKPGTSTKAWLPDPEDPLQNTELESFGCEDKDGDGWADGSESKDMDLDPNEYLDIDRDGTGSNSDYNDNDARIQTIQDHCNLDFTDVRDVCVGWRTPAYVQYVADSVAANQTAVSYSSWNTTSDSTTTDKAWYETNAVNDALVYGGGLFGILTLVILIIGILASRRKSTQTQKTYGAAGLPTSAAMDEALEGTAGSSAFGGVESDSLWEEDVKPLNLEEQEKEEKVVESSRGVSAEELFSDEESIESIATLGESTPEPEAESAPVPEEPQEAPPLPEGGLPEGWTMDQWKWYGHEYLAKMGNQ